MEVSVNRRFPHAQCCSACRNSVFWNAPSLWAITEFFYSATRMERQVHCFVQQNYQLTRYLLKLWRNCSWIPPLLKTTFACEPCCLGSVTFVLVVGSYFSRGTDGSLSKRYSAEKPCQKILQDVNSDFFILDLNVITYFPQDVSISHYKFISSVNIFTFCSPLSPGLEDRE